MLFFIQQDICTQLFFRLHKSVYVTTVRQGRRFSSVFPLVWVDQRLVGAN